MEDKTNEHFEHQLELTHKLAIQFNTDLVNIQKEVSQEVAIIVYKLMQSKRLWKTTD